MTNDQLVRMDTPDTRANPILVHEELILVHLNPNKLKNFTFTKRTKYVLLKYVPELVVHRAEHGYKVKVHNDVLSLFVELLPATVWS